MPRTKLQPITKEQAKSRSKNSVCASIRSAMAEGDVDILSLSKLSGIGYQTICRRMRKESEWTLSDLFIVADKLKMTDEQILRMFGR